jgi:preprotein translocase subunit SecE
MTDDIKTQEPTTADKAKLTAAIVLVIAGLAGYYALGAESVWQRWGAVVAGLVLAGALLAFSTYGRQFRQFMELARIELRKIVWPTRDDALKTTGVVFLFVTVAGVFFWVLDLVLAWATRFLTGQGS